VGSLTSTSRGKNKAVMPGIRFIGAGDKAQQARLSPARRWERATCGGRFAVFRKILLAYDGSESARKAFDQLLKLVTHSKCDIAIVAVVRPSEFALDVEAQTVLENACSDLGTQLEALQKRARFVGVESTVMIRLGHPAQQIVRAAQEWHADLIVTGRRGGGSLAHWLRGSISKRILATAPCAVLVVR
jgi:nucleotide-binding universal stress UspA family protein